MFAFGILFVTATVFQAILAQEPQPPIPAHCRGPPPNVEKPHECCKIPSMFAEEDLEACGIHKLEDQPEGGKFRGPPDCTKPTCILKKYNLLKDDDIDYEAVSSFLDKWAEKNENFKPAVDIAKKRCLGELPGPPQVCDADKMVFCIGATIFSECPTWEDNENCKKLKSHIESCKLDAPKPL